MSDGHDSRVEHYLFSMEVGAPLWFVTTSAAVITTAILWLEGEPVPNYVQIPLMLVLFVWFFAGAAGGWLPRGMWNV